MFPPSDVHVEFIDCPESGNVSEDLEFVIKVSDKSGKDVKLTIDWNDDSPDYESGFFSSPHTFTISHSWDTEDEYIIIATGMNIDGYSSDTACEITIGGTTCLAPGTEITLTDGNIKKIEEIHVGDQVISYNLEKNEYSSWIVSRIGKPIHPICEINNGLIWITKEHPIYIKKQNGNIGWGAIEPNQNKVRIKEEILKLEIGDEIYSETGEWIKIINISYHDKPVQTYNILSVSGNNNYFANNILVYEDLPPIPYMFKWYLGKFLESHPNLIPLFLPILDII